MSIFDKRVAYKPFEYPDVVQFKKAIQQSYWTVDEWSFESDKHQFMVELNETERNAIKNTLLAISQIEVGVKEFWGKVGDRFPKAEIKAVGATFAESEVRHADAYSHLLEVLDLNGDFEQLLTVPVIQGRVDYMSKYLRGAADNANQNYVLTLTLFAMFIENVSLFSQFAIIKSFNKAKNMLKDVDNVVQATQKEEELHALFGAELVKIVKREFPEWFDEDFYEKIYRASMKAYDAEEKIVDWIFEAGELSFLPKDTVKEFIKHRFNHSLALIGGQPVFDIDESKLEGLKWFTEEMYADVAIDFFNKKSTLYAKKTQSFNPEDLF